jgi:hypothetical protein
VTAALKEARLMDEQVDGEMNKKVISYQGTDESRYLRIRSAYASHSVREILEEEVDVLDRADEVLLDGNIPQATPSGVFHPEADAVSKIAFHDVLPCLNVAGPP